MPEAPLRGEHLIAKWLARPYSTPTHADLHQTCPGCNENVMRVAIVNLAYTLEVCRCGDPDYIHLIERSWHLRCLGAYCANRPESDKDPQGKSSSRG